MKQLSSQTFCAAPWFMIRNDNQGHYRPCCAFESSNTDFNGDREYDRKSHSPVEWLDSDYMKYVRNNLYNNIELKECNECWSKESHGIVSHRQIYNQEILGDRDPSKTWVKNYFQHKPILDFGMVIWADIKTTNICNLSCAMCHPGDSSMIYTRWLRDTGNEFVLEYTKNNPDYFKKINNAYKQEVTVPILDWVLEQSQLRIVKLLGGEPLLDKNLIDKLDKLDPDRKKNLTIMFVTNGTVDIATVVARLPGFKLLHFVVSVEGIGIVNDYIRKGSKWSVVEKNILQAQQLPGVQVSVAHTIQAITLPKFSELLNWAQLHSLEISYNLLTSPEYLSINALDQYLIESIISDLPKNHPISNLLLQAKSDLHLKEKMLKYIQWYEEDSAIKLGNVCPELTGTNLQQ